jgi:hypothetical protein
MNIFLARQHDSWPLPFRLHLGLLANDNPETLCFVDPNIFDQEKRKGAGKNA